MGSMPNVFTVRGVEVRNWSHVDNSVISDYIRDTLDIADYHGWEMDLRTITVDEPGLPDNNLGKYLGPEHKIQIAAHAIDCDTLLHEVVHHAHYLRMLGDHYGRDNSWFLKEVEHHIRRWGAGAPIFKRIVKRNIGPYAASNFVETVVGVAVHHCLDGRELSDVMYDIYEMFDGPPLRKV